MNLVALRQKLIAAARANTPADHVPYAFEKRITALLVSRVAPQHLEAWVRGLWRAAISCVAISLLLGAWVIFSSMSNAGSSVDLSQNFETTLLASVDQNDQAP